jgi:heat shock protein HslJ
MWVDCRSHAGSPETPRGEIAPVASTGSAAGLSLDALAGTDWILRAWDEGEPTPDEPQVTLTYRDGRFTGTSGCNRYTAAASAGDAPGDLAVGPIGTSRMACPDSQAAVEARFLKQLARATRFEVQPGRLALSYEKEGGAGGTMWFEERRPARSAPP